MPPTKPGVWVKRCADKFAKAIVALTKRTASANDRAHVVLADGVRIVRHWHKEIIEACMQFYLPNAPGDYYVRANYPIEGSSDATAVILAFQAIVETRSEYSRLGAPPHAARRTILNHSTDAAQCVRMGFLEFGVDGKLNRMIHSFITWFIGRYVGEGVTDINFLGLIEPDTPMHMLMNKIETKDAFSLLEADSDITEVRAALVLDKLLRNCTKKTTVKKALPPPREIPQYEWGSDNQDPSENEEWLDEQLRHYQASPLPAHGMWSDEQTEQHQPSAPSDYHTPAVEGWSCTQVDPWQPAPNCSNFPVVKEWLDAQNVVRPASPITDHYPLPDNDALIEELHTPGTCSPVVTDYTTDDMLTLDKLFGAGAPYPVTIFD